MTWLLIIQMGFVFFHLILFYLFSFKHKYIMVMQVFSLIVTKTSLQGGHRAGRVQVKPDFVVCIAFSISCWTLQRADFPLFILICMLLFELHYSVEVSAFQFFSTNIMPHSLSQASPEQIAKVCKYKQKTKVGKLQHI